VIATTGYFLSVTGRRGYLSLGRRAYTAFTGLTIAMAGLLMHEILTHNFQLEYVNSYSSSDLPLFLLISTFWAGQAGTFLLWLLFTALIGLIIYRQSDPETPAVMFYYLLGALFLLVLLAVRSPFTMLPFVPEEGSGLNPLLHNFWMIIHPPIVFVGFALMAVPFSLAMAALTRHEYTAWTNRALPWVLLSSAILGIGIFLGGYWAYETLGWGGYWAWDPVENASLIPWLTNLALLHGLLVERKYGQLRKSNLLLASFGFLLVIYGTFLTRSGVLADFSVHSFTDLGMNAYLVLFLAGFLVMILVLFTLRSRQIRPLKRTDDPWSADFLMAVGMVVTTAFALLVLIGTSSPLITRLPFFSAPANVSTNYYDRIALPIGVMMALLAGVTPFLKNKNAGVGTFLRRSIPSVVAGAIGLLLGMAFGVDSVRHATLVFFAVYTVSANVHTLIASPHRLGKRMGGDLAHIGFGMIVIGFLASSVFVRSEKAVLGKGDTSEVLGYSITYTGLESEITQKHNAVNLVVQNNDAEFVADPKLYFDSYSRSIMREPYIKPYLFHDLYIAPEKLETVQPGESATLSKGETRSVAGRLVTFHEFDLSSHDETGSIQVGAVVTVTDGGDSVEVVPRLAVMANGRRDDTPVSLDTLGTVLTLDDVNPANGTANLRISSEEDIAQDFLVVEVSTMPLIILVWLGAAVIVAGTLTAAYHRYKISTVDNSKT
jgi:cytochrome c-type biogenesis protein CcmF